MRMRFYYLGLVFILAVFLFTSAASAGIGNWFKGITGHATNAETNVTVTLQGANNVTIEVFNDTLTGASVTPDENTFKAVTFKARVTDLDGAVDINTTSVRANFSVSGEALRENSTCVETDSATTYSRNFSCTINIWYFDAPGTWSISVGATDISLGNFKYNTTQIFSMGTRTSMVMSPTAITFGSVTPGGVNQTATNDPSVLNNTGNANITNITVTAVNLYGLNEGALIDVGNFTVGNNTGSSAECDTSAGNSASVMVNNSQIQVGNSQLLRGNHSIGDGSGQEDLFYCFRSVPLVATDTYSPPNLWTVTIV